MKSAFPLANVVGAILALGLSSAAGVAQQPAGPAIPSTTANSSTEPTNGPQIDPQNAAPALTVRSDEALKNFEPAENEEYTLGAGDEITLDFPGRPELTIAGTQTIGPDGRITLPLVGAVHVADLTRAQAQKVIVDALSPLYTDDLSVTVRINKFTSNRVRVIGYVMHPGEVPFEGTPTLLDAIGRAGLISPTVSVNGVASNTGPGVPETCIIYRGNSIAVEVKLKEMLVTGNALADLRLRRNDIVYVPEPKQLFVSVLGQVKSPGTIPLRQDSTLTSILAQAGCCSEDGGFNPKIQILQNSTGKAITVQYKQLLTLAGQKEYTLHPGDVIYVPISGFNKVSDVITKLSPVATMISFAAIAGMQ